MTPREQVIEAMARTLTSVCSDGNSDAQAVARAALDTLLAELPGLGLRIVPAKATITQVVAGLDYVTTAGIYHAVAAAAPDVLGAPDG